MGRARISRKLPVHWEQDRHGRHSLLTSPEIEEGGRGNGYKNLLLSTLKYIVEARDEHPNPGCKQRETLAEFDE